MINKKDKKDIKDINLRLLSYDKMKIRKTLNVKMSFFNKMNVLTADTSKLSTF